VRRFGGERLRARGIAQQRGRCAGAREHEVATEQPAAVDERLRALAIHALGTLEERGRTLPPCVLDPGDGFIHQLGMAGTGASRPEPDDLTA
jgi:hypothetical protein